MYDNIGLNENKIEQVYTHIYIVKPFSMRMY